MRILRCTKPEPTASCTKPEPTASCTNPNPPPIAARFGAHGAFGDEAWSRSSSTGLREVPSGLTRLTSEDGDREIASDVKGP